MYRSGNQLLIGDGDGGYVLQFDMAADKSRVLWSRWFLKDDMEGMGDTSSPLIGQGGKWFVFNIPFEITGDWLWASKPFVRGNVETGKTEMLPTVGAGILTIIGATPD